MSNDNLNNASKTDKDVSQIKVGKEAINRLNVVSSFTVEPIREPLCTALKDYHVDLDVYFNQEHNIEFLLSRNGFKKQDLNLVFLRLQDLTRNTYFERAEPDVKNIIDLKSRVEKEIKATLVNILNLMRQSNHSKYIVVLCQPSPEALKVLVKGFFDKVEEQLSDFCYQSNNMELIAMSDFSRSNSDEYFDLTREKLGNIPFKPFYFELLAAITAKSIASLSHNHNKVIVVDADNTLWNGVCGESNNFELLIDKQHKYLQQFLIEQMRNGMLLCLASKNSFDDVEKVFREHPGMLLKLEDFVSCRVNWEAKSTNIDDMARELNLSTNSFIFIDDNPVECEEVKAHCSDVLSIQFSQETDKAISQIKRMNLFCSLPQSEEDRVRSQRYKQNAIRERHKNDFSSFSEFIQSLGLEISIKPIAESDIPRVAQMTQRTNQFNFNKSPMSIEDIQYYLEQTDHFGFVATVADRFGEYGTTGLALFSKHSDYLSLDTFLISCRVLGRGVEFELLKNIGELAQQYGLGVVNVRARRTPKNMPAIQFLKLVANNAELKIPDIETQVKLITEQLTLLEFDNRKSSTLSGEINPNQIEIKELSSKSEEIPKFDDSFNNLLVSGYKENLLISLLNLVKEVCNINISEMNPSQSFESNGISSFYLIDLTVKINDIYGEIPVDLLFNCNSFDELVDYLVQHNDKSVREVLAKSKVLDIDETNNQRDAKDEVSNIGTITPSFSQEAMWAMDGLGQARLAHTLPFSLIIRNRIDYDALEKSFITLLAKNPILKSQFSSSGGEAVINFANENDFKLNVIDLSSFSASELKNEVNKIKAHERREPFRLDKDILVRANLIRIREEHYILLVTIHHIVSDGWTLRVILGELSKYYKLHAGSSGQRPSDSKDMSFFEFSLAEKQKYITNDFYWHKEFWQNSLSGVVPYLDFRMNEVDADSKSYLTKVKHFSLSRTNSEDLRFLCRRLGVSMHSALLSIFSLLIGQYTSRDDFLIGTPVSNRTSGKYHNSIGYFVNIIPVRVQIEQSNTFQAHIENVAKTIKSTRKYSDFPFSKIVEMFGVSARNGANPLVQVLFALQNTPVDSNKLLDSEFSILEEHREESLFDLTLEVDDTLPELKGRFEYNLQLFDKNFIEVFSSSYVELLNSLLFSSSEPISSHKFLLDKDLDCSSPHASSYLSKYERSDIQQLIKSYFESYSLNELEANPSRAFDKSDVSLNDRIDSCVALLVKAGVKQGDEVGLYVDDIKDILVFLVAAIRVGAILVPLEPELPRLNLVRVVEFSQLNYIVADDRIKGFLDFKLAVDQIFDSSSSEQKADLQWLLTKSTQNHENKSTIQRIEKSQVFLKIYYTDDNANSKSISFGNHAIHEYSLSPPSRDLLGFVTNGISCMRIFSCILQVLKCVLNNSSSFDSLVGIESKLNERNHGVAVGECQEAFVILDRYNKPAIAGLGELCLIGFEPSTQNRNNVFVDGPETNCIQANTNKTDDNLILRTGRYVRLSYDKNGLPLLSRCSKFSASTKALAVGFGELRECLKAIDGIENAAIKEFSSQARISLCCFLKLNEFTNSIDSFNKKLRHCLSSQKGLLRIPDHVELIDESCIDSSGNINDALLPKLVLDSRSSREVVDPTTKTEERLLHIWRQCLGIERLGIDDNYFVMGGDSIRSLYLVNTAQANNLIFTTKELFDYPTVRKLANWLDNTGTLPSEQYLEPNKFDLVTASEKTAVFEHFDEQLIEDIYPLSMMQQGMVHLSIKQRHLNAYQNMHIYRFNRRYEHQNIMAALTYLVEKHPMLRTIYDLKNDRPLQVVLKPHSPSLHIVDLRGDAEPAIKQVIDDWVNNEHQQGLELDKSLWRLTIHIVNDEEFLFCMFIHHAQWDGWSLESFATELYKLYDLAVIGEAFPQYQKLPSYSQFVALEKEAASSEAQQKYWRSKLKGIHLPWWAGREKSKSVTVECDVSLSTSMKLTELSKKLGVQEKSVWCAVYLALVAVLDASDEVAGPVITQGRPEIPDGDKIVGVFLNALVMRISLAKKTWNEFILKTDEELREQHGYRHFPLAELQKLTGFDFSASVFTYTNWHVYYEGNDKLDSSNNSSKLESARELTTPQKISVTQATNYLLSMYVCKDDKTQRFEASFTADSGVFDAEFRERIKGYIERIIDEIENNSDLAIRKNRLLGDYEANALLDEFNSTEKEFLEAMCIHTLLEKQAENYGDSVAVEFTDATNQFHQVSYRMLNERANQLAHYLIAQGVGLEVRVGICIERSPEMIVAILGVLKAGGCYVPMDPQYPSARLEYIMEDSKCHLVLSENHLLADLSFLNSVKSLPLDEHIQRVLLNKYPKHNIPDQQLNPSSDNLAYIIYTSGSTGKPKGVAVSHKNLVNLALFQSENYNIRNSSRLLQFASFSFDAATWDWSMALSSGATIHLISDEDTKSPEAVSKIINAHHITYSFIPPSMLALLNYKKFNNLKTLTVGGESPSLDVLQKWASRCDVFNAYGPTENTVVATTMRVNSNTSRLLIGKPIENVKCYVLNDNNELIPSKVIGELHIGGKGVSRGYMHEPASTASKYIPDMFSGEQGSRLYKTGDLVRYIPETASSEAGLEFLGRIDSQVKIRGFRIELKEIEAVLQEHLEVKDVLVLACSDENANQFIAAYVLTQVDDDLCELEFNNINNKLVYELKSLAQSKLPSYMVPSSIMLLDEFPTTPSGKVDTKALPQPDFSFRQEFSPPVSRTEKQLAELWVNVLGSTQVSRFDNFFDLGGHSLLVTQLLTRIREEFNAELSMKILFEVPVLAEQSEVIDELIKKNKVSKSRLMKVQENRDELHDFEGVLEEGEI